MSKATWVQYRAIILTGFITVNLDTALENSNEWTDFETAYKQYQLYKSTGMNAKLQKREVTFGSMKENEIESMISEREE